VFGDPTQYCATELVAGAAAAQELHAAWYAVFVGAAPEGDRRDASKRSAYSSNRTLAESLGGQVVNLTAADPVEDAIAFAATQRITHVIVGRGRGVSAMPAGTLEQRCAERLRGVEVRVVQSAETSASSGWRLWLNRGQVLPIALLFAVFVLATAAIVYVSWPIVFALAVIAGAVWCWHLEQPTMSVGDAPEVGVYADTAATAARAPRPQRP
jgi:K+-sensing histidine kinase KdpD